MTSDLFTSPGWPEGWPGVFSETPMRGPTPEQQSSMVAMYLTGQSARAVAAAHGYGSDRPVLRTLQLAGVSPRRHGVQPGQCKVFKFIPKPADGIDLDSLSHPIAGWTAHYKRGCRCKLCVVASREFQAHYRARKRSAEPEYFANKWQNLKRSDRGADGIRKRMAARSRCPKHRARTIIFNSKKQNSRRSLLAEIKLARGCADCGYKKHQSALDFDHVKGDKVLNVGLMGTYSIARIMEEVAKCEVVCFNCHRVREQARLLRGERTWQTPQATHERAARGRERRDRGRSYLTKLKLQHGCKDCGYRLHSAALDFDHVRGVKKFTLSRRLAATIPTLAAEVAKCEVVCANCHRIRTVTRKRAIAKRAKLQSQ